MMADTTLWVILMASWGQSVVRTVREPRLAMAEPRATSLQQRGARGRALPKAARISCPVCYVSFSLQHPFAPKAPHWRTARRFAMSSRQYWTVLDSLSLRSSSLCCRTLQGRRRPLATSSNEAPEPHLLHRFTLPPGSRNSTLDATGLSVWGTARPLLGHLKRHVIPSFQQEKSAMRVLELGAGCGLVGLGLASSCKNSRVVLTDHADAVEWLRKKCRAELPTIISPIPSVFVPSSDSFKRWKDAALSDTMLSDDDVEARIVQPRDDALECFRPLWKAMNSGNEEAILSVTNTFDDFVFLSESFYVLSLLPSGEIRKDMHHVCTCPAYSRNHGHCKHSMYEGVKEKKFDKPIQFQTLERGKGKRGRPPKTTKALKKQPDDLVPIEESAKKISS